MRRLAYLVVGMLLAAPVRADDDWPVPRGPSHEPSPYRYDPKTLQDVPKAFLEDAPACVLYTRTTHLVEPDGTVEATSHEITRFNGRKGIEKLGEYRSISFNPRYEKLTLNEAQVLKADGTVVPIEPRHVQLRDIGTDYQVYDDDKQLVISWPNLQVGDAYEVKWTVRGKNPEFGGEFFARYTFGDDDYPVVRDELFVRVPKGKALRYAAVNGKIDLTRTETRTGTDYHWAVIHKTPLPRDEDRPSKEELRWQLACSTFPSWEAIGQWKQKVRAECWECGPEIKKVVEKVAGGQKTPLEKARALTYWVRQNIRYLSRGPEGMGYTPHPPTRVLANLFGDCKDQAQLLAVMLREVGVSVWLATLGTLDDGQVLPDVPSPWGTHAILLAEIEGKEYWIDTTLSQAAWDFLPRGDCDRQTYLTQDGKIKLARTPPHTYKDFRVEQTTHVTVASDGSTRSRRQVSYHGASAWYKREAWIDAPLGERRRLVTAELQDAHNKSRLLALKVSEKNLHDFDEPVRAEVEFEVPDHFAGDPHEGALSDSVVWTRLLAYTLDPSRDLPFELPTPFESVHRFVVQLPPALRCNQPPAEKKVQSKWGSFALTVHVDPKDAHRIDLVMHTRLEKVRVEKDDFTAFQQFHDELSKAYRAWLTLRPTRDPADAPALEALLAVAPGGEPHSAKVLARLYLDNGKAADARRVLAGATKHHPQDKALWDLRLEAAGGAKEKEALYREIIQLFPKEGQYVAALGANLVERKEYAEANKVLLPLTAHEVGAVRGAAHYHLARACYQQGQLRDALKHLDAAVEADVAVLTDVDLLAFKARVHEKLGEAREAIETYRLGLQIDGKAHDLLDPLARLEWREGLKADALDHLRRYTVAVGKGAAGLVKAAELHLALGRPDDALELAGRIAQEDLSPEAHRVLGLAHLQRKEYPQAVAHLENAGSGAETLMGLMEAHVALGDLDAAAAAARTVDGLGDPGKELLARRARLKPLLERRDALLAQLAPPKEKQPAAARAVGRFVCAEYGLKEHWTTEHVAKVAGEAIEHWPEFGPALALRGWLALGKGQLGKALADAEKAIALPPPDARAYLVRGRVRLERGDATGALADLEQAAKLGGRKDAVVLHWLAAAQCAAGQLSAALQTQREAVQLDPGDVELAEQLRELEKRASN
jgi:tetratricopeptide (TPR) repeat protein